MSIDPGTTLGPYSVTAKIGEGGMGEVYRARDTKLDRDVALKVLPEAFTQDPDRLARFEREAKVLASLNHPNIAAIYGLEEADGTRALVLELVEGPTLADRISKGPIPLDEALPIAKQIAEALEAAHEAGVIHRDLKPANIKVKDDGTVKVLDFGLAKAFQPDASDPGLSQSPTISLTAAATQMGMVLGTAAYMAPEQASGKVVDKRADVWAFGVVLYEMLTGTRPFVGDDVSKTLARVIDREPDWSALPENVPPVLSNFLRRCLQKNPKKRIRDIGDVSLALEGAFETTVSAPSETGVAPTRPVWQRPIPIGFVLLVSTGLVGLVVWSMMRAESGDLMRFTIVPSAPLSGSGLDNDLAISRDGTQIVYAAFDPSGAPQLYLRPVDQLVEAPLRGGEGGEAHFFSPDGEWVGFVANNTTLRKTSIFGGPPVTLAESTGRIRGASWGSDDQIVFGVGGEGLARVSAGGGEPDVLTTPDPELGERTHSWPFIIPGREAVLFVTSTGLTLTTGQLAVLDLTSGEVTQLGLAGLSPHYVSTGHLVYADLDGTMRGVPFDVTSLEVTGSPIPMVEGVRVKISGAANISIAENGRLVYAAGAGPAILGNSLAWVDRAGREEPITAPAELYAYPRISPDGSRVALDARGEDDNIWIWDLAQETRTRLIVGDSGGQYPVWAPDGEHVAYQSDGNIYWKASNNTGTPELLAGAPGTEGGQGSPSTYFFTPDGTALVFRDEGNTSEIEDDLVMIAIDDGEPIWRLAGDFNERNAELSPDGRWMAYQSDESGEWQIYVRPFPQVEEDQVQVSNNGGIKPLWSRDGRELFYVQRGAAPELISVSVESNESDRTFAFGDREAILNWPYFTAPEGRTYDVSPDGQQFLVIKGAGDDPTNSAQPKITVVLNWFQELEERVPVP